MPTPAQFIWYELVTTDLDAALAFYSGVVGWKTHDAGLTDRRYTILNAGERGVGGAMALPPGARRVAPGRAGSATSTSTMSTLSSSG